MDADRLWDAGESSRIEQSLLKVESQARFLLRINRRADGSQAARPRLQVRELLVQIAAQPFELLWFAQSSAATVSSCFVTKQR